MSELGVSEELQVGVLLVTSPFVSTLARAAANMDKAVGKTWAVSSPSVRSSAKVKSYSVSGIHTWKQENIIWKVIIKNN